MPVCAHCDCPIAPMSAFYVCRTEETPARELYFHQECLETEGARVSEDEA